MLEKRNTIGSPADLFVLLLHYMLINDGFHCTVTSTTTTATTTAATTGSTDDTSSDQGKATRVPHDWNSAASQGMYSFQYRHDRSSMTFTVKMSLLGRHRLIVNAIALEQEERMISTEFDVSDFIDEAQWHKWNNQQGSEREDASLFENVFRNLDRLELAVRTQLVRRLVPESKEGYEQEQQAGSSGVVTGSGASAEQDREYQEWEQQRRRRMGQRPGEYGGEEEEEWRDDPLRIGPPRRPMRGGPPIDYGFDSDLYPELNPPMYLPGRGGFGGIPGGGGGGGGSRVGPGHPAFGNTGIPPHRGPPGGVPAGVPPGARFDPYYPVVPGGRGGRGRGGNGGGPGSGEPNPDHMPPPRFNPGGGDINPYGF